MFYDKKLVGVIINICDEVGEISYILPIIVLVGWNVKIDVLELWREPKSLGK